MNIIKETVIISGKGGTGKTSVTASLIPFMKDAVFADCDVDAPNLSILLNPERKKEELFYGMKRAVFNKDLCISCGQCLEHCHFGAIMEDYSVKTASCEGCAVCVHICPTDAMTMEKVAVGSLFESNTPYGTMVHARLIPGEETSGRLVSQVRKNAMLVAQETGKSHILIDGPPGIGCSVISSVTGADSVCIVTEPTISGLHDMKRVYTMILRFNPEVFIIINKSDLSDKICDDIDEFARENDIPVILRIPFRKEIIQALSLKQIPSLAEKEFFRDLGWEDVIEKLNPSEIQ
jgi:MinD superfamily P-loop ATPase